MIHINLEGVKVPVNDKESATYTRASCGEFESIGDHGCIRAVADMLMEDGRDPEEEVYVLRGNTLCFHPDTLLRWSQGKQGTKEKDAI